MTKLVQIIVALALTTVTNEARASQSLGAHVINVVPNNAGTLLFYVDSARTGVPSCASSTSTSFAVNVNTMAGQAMAASLLTALAAKLFVDVGGTGACDVASNVETAGYAAVRY